MKDERTYLLHAIAAIDTIQSYTAEGRPDEAPEAAYSLGVLLYERGRFEEAEAAYRLAIDSVHPNQAPKAAVNLGVLLYERERCEEAEAALRLAIDSGHPEHAPIALGNLGVLLLRQERFDELKAVFRLMIDSGHTDKAPEAAFNLGVLLEKQECFEEAEAALLPRGATQLPTSGAASARGGPTVFADHSTKASTARPVRASVKSVA